MTGAPRLPAEPEPTPFWIDPAPQHPGGPARDSDDAGGNGADIGVTRRLRAVQPSSRRAQRAAPDPAARRRTLLQRLALLLLSLLLVGWSLAPLVRVGPRGLGTPVATLIVVLAGGVGLVSLAALVLGTVAGRRGAWESVAVCLVAGVVPWTFLVPYAVDNQPVAAGRNAMSLRVLLVNADQGGASAQDIHAAVQANAVDLLVVTELTGTLAHDLTTVGLTRRLKTSWVALPGEAGAPTSPEAGAGVWSRVPVTATEPVVGTLWPAARLSLTVGGLPVTLVTGHVDSPPQAVAHWALDLSLLRDAAVAGPGAHLVVANLNATPWNADLRAYGDVGLRDASDVAGGAPRPTWPGWAPVPLLPLDHVLVSQEIGVRSIDTVVVSGTDHRGLLVDLSVPRAADGG